MLLPVGRIFALLLAPLPGPAPLLAVEPPLLAVLPRAPLLRDPAVVTDWRDE